MSGPAAPSTPSVAVNVGGAFTGQLAAGSDNTQVALNINVGDAAGETLAFLDKALGIERITPPIDARPTDFPDLLGRDADLAAAGKPIAPSWVDVVGVAGIGKTALLRHLAGQWGLSRQPDGMVYLPAGGMVDLDIAYAIFDLFYRTRPRGRPSRGELVSSLGAIKAVVMLDDVDDAHLADTLALMRGTTFVVAGQRPMLTEGTRLVLGGLDATAALGLVERGLGRPLEPDERADAARIADALHGVPADILREVGDAAVDGRSLADVANALAGSGPATAATVLGDDEHKVVAAAAALGGVPVGREHLAAVTGAPAACATLEKRGIVRAASPELVLDSSWQARMTGAKELTEWHSRWLDYFASWASNSASSPAAVTAEAPALAYLLAPTRFGMDPQRAKILVRAILPALTLTSRWGLRRRLLELVVASVDTNLEPEGGAWALHQLGTQDVVEGRLTEARDNLSRALDIRRRIGDTPGAKATEQNLAVLDRLGPPIPRAEQQEGTKPVPVDRGWSRLLLPLVAGAVVVVAVVVGWLLLNAGGVGATVSPGNLAFATAAVGDTSEAQNVRITAGDKPVHITNVRIDQPGGFQLVGPVCIGAQLAANTSCDESIVFVPTKEGSANASLLVSVEGRDAPLEVKLSADATVPTPTPIPSTAVVVPSLAPPVTPSPTPSSAPANLVINVFDLGPPRHEADGWYVPVTVTIANGGDSDAPLFQVALLRNIRGTDIIPFQVEGQTGPVPATTAPLSPGGAVTITGFAVLPPSTVGKVTIDVEADSCAADPQVPRTPCRVVETRENDNSFRGTVTFPQGPDLVVLKIEQATGSAPNSDNFRNGSYVAVVANTGTADAGATLVVGDLVGGDAKMPNRAVTEVGPLAAGQQRTIKDSFGFFYTPGPAGPPQLALTIDPCDIKGGCRVKELNEDNNTTTGPIQFADAPGG